MKEFQEISREDAIKKIAEYFNTLNFKTVGIVFEKQKDATAFLDEVKQFLNKKILKFGIKSQSSLTQM